MSEAILCGFVVFAVGYVALMRQMARSADVLHGGFIQPDRPDGFPRPATPSWFATIQRYLPAMRLPAQR